jgi:hypothetical protein
LHIGPKRFTNAGDEATKKTAVREVKILRMLRQDNIVHLHDAALTMLQAQRQALPCVRTYAKKLA